MSTIKFSAALNAAGVSDVISKVFAAASTDVEKHVAAVFTSLSQELLEECKSFLTPEILMKCWTKACPAYAKAIQSGLDKIAQKKENEVKRAEEKAKRAEGPKCGHRYGANAKNTPNQLCGEYCKDATVFHNKEGQPITLCPKHFKNGMTKHTCQWAHGAEAPKKNGTLCGCRVKAAAVFSRDGSWQDVSYAGKWLCDKHIKRANASLDMIDHQCPVSGAKNNVRCDKLCKKNEDGSWGEKCSKHSKSKKSKKSGSKKASDQRKALKSGKKGKKDTKDKKEKAEKKSKKSEEEKSEVKEETKSEEKTKGKSKGVKDKKEKETKKVSEEKKEEKTEEKSPKNKDKPKNSTETKVEKSGTKPKVNEPVKTKNDEDSDEESDEETEKDLNVEPYFNASALREISWVMRRIDGEPDEDGEVQQINIFVDRNSGLVAHNPNDADETEPENETLVVLGTWDNGRQDYAELEKNERKYAKALGLALE